MDDITLNQQIEFLRMVVFPSFTEHPNDQDERKVWIKEKVQNRYSNIFGSIIDELLILFGHLQTLQAAIDERNSILQQQTNQAALLQQQHSIPFLQEDEATFLQPQRLSSTSSTVGIYEFSSKRKRNSNSSVEDENDGIELESKILRTSKTAPDFFDELPSIDQHRPTLKEALGGEHLWECKGRDQQLCEILEHLKKNPFSSSKPAAFYFHASPGVGKTFLLSQLYEKKFPQQYAYLKNEFFFLVADFNGDCCSEDLSFREILKNPKLFVILRIYYVEFVNRRKIWSSFLNSFFEFATTVQLMDDALNFMIKKLQDKSRGKVVVLLVDEIMKTENFKDSQFPDCCRSALCNLMNDHVCHYVLFSSLSTEFMRKESGSQRPMISVCSLPLLTPSDTLDLIEHHLNDCTFTTSEIENVNKGEELKRKCIKTLAVYSAGHGRTIENFVGLCSKNQTENITDLIMQAAERSPANRVKHSHDILLAVLLGKEVNRNDEIAGKTFDLLVSEGVLINSFNGDEVKFVPSCPILFLYRWTQTNYNKSPKIYDRLKNIFKLKFNFNSTNFETIHTHWEIMIRLIRLQEEFKYLPISKVYKTSSRENSSDRNYDNIIFCPVDAQTELTSWEYNASSSLSVRPNTIMVPPQNNAGWDRLIFYECFPVPGSDQKYVLPVFIQHKYSKQDAKTKLDTKTIMKAFNDCNEFLEKRCTFQSDYELIPIKTNPNHFGHPSYQFVIIFIARQNYNQNIFTNIPSNFMFCFGKDFNQLYGPTLGEFINDLDPQRSDIVPSSSTTSQINIETKGGEEDDMEEIEEIGEIEEIS